MPIGNSDVLPLEYSGYEILDGKPALEGLPATYCEEGDKVQTLVIRLEDTYQNVDVFLSYSVFEDLDAITRSTRQAMIMTQCLQSAAILRRNISQCVR